MKTSVAILTLAFSGLASAAPVTDFHPNEYQFCKLHSQAALQLAIKAADSGQAVETLLNRSAAVPTVLDTKLALLASDALKANTFVASSLQEFVAGVCYESPLPKQQ
jgi:hypothetical protein